MFEGNWNFLRRKILFLSDINSGPPRPSQTHSEEIQGSYAIVSKKRKKMPKIKPEYSLLPPEEAKKEDQKQQQSVDQESKDNLTFENDENRDKNAATTNKTDAKIGKSDAKPGQIKEKKIKENKNKRKENFIQIQREGGFENFEDLEFKKWQKELLNDEDWCATLVRFSENDEGHFSPTQRRLYMPEEARQAIINSKAMAWLLKREFDAMTELRFDDEGVRMAA